ncbi:putative isopenicillin N synthetase [Cylindrobasidium torrendii FP15055 ss-10]|uniref:Putative isopenicillin N synthetase n=1 Tax=Cylindrobasidium torrendii FP15055 ss-10 TaxID=1314674 RepID=A0A0D7BIS5_9AGAR|nr:putative isopenicillin N synthetase [Cylindrobasidium torrendii FP15055 ss-10]
MSTTSTVTSQFVDYRGVVRQLKSDTGAAKSVSFSEVPVIDIAPFLDGSNKQKVVEELKNAAMNVGFLYLKGHGLPEEVAKRAFEAAKTFFELPEDDKMSVYFKKSPEFRGWEPPKGRTHAKGDLKEAYNWGYEPSADTTKPCTTEENEAFMEAHPEAGRNVWPDKIPELRDALYGYYGETLAVGRSITRIFALALELPEDYFLQMFDRPGVLARALYYPPQDAYDEADGETKGIGIGAHSDIEMFTLLLQGPNVSCLQVLNQEGEWIKAPPIPGTLVMNIGDMLSRWTNGKFVSTVHRVINTTPHTARYSLPTFFGPSYRTIIDVLPSCVFPGEKSQFEPIEAGEYVFRRLARSRLGAAYNEAQSVEELREAVKQAAMVPT